ncbi:MAG: hypothetical protein ABI925_04335 [Verrucomicrobiota bacterium]
MRHGFTKISDASYREPSLDGAMEAQATNLLSEGRKVIAFSLNKFHPETGSKFLLGFAFTFPLLLSVFFRANESVTKDARVDLVKMQNNPSPGLVRST